MTRIEALKKLAEKVTGVRPTGRTIAQIINAIAENYSGGGGGGMVVHLHYAADDGINYEMEADKTPLEVAEAMRNGTNVIINYIDDESRDEYWLNAAFNNYGNAISGYYADDSGAYAQVQGRFSDNKWY